MSTNVAGSTRIAALRVNVTHPCHDVTLFRVAGDVDLFTAAEFRMLLSSALDTCDPTVVVDLSGVDFFGLVGVQVLLDTQEQIVPAHELRLVTSVRAVNRVLDVAGLAARFMTFVSVDDALASVCPEDVSRV